MTLIYSNLISTCKQKEILPPGPVFVVINKSLWLHYALPRVQLQSNQHTAQSETTAGC